MLGYAMIMNFAIIKLQLRRIECLTNFHWTLGSFSVITSPRNMIHASKALQEAMTVCNKH